VAASPAAPLLLPARLDYLTALLGLAAAEARRYQLPALAARLDALAVYAGALLRAAQRHGGLPSLPGSTGGPAPGAAVPAPGPHDHAILHWLNLARAAAREAEGLARMVPEGVGGLADGAGRLAEALEALAGLVHAGPLSWSAAP
jgi:hypothetical protein